MLCAQGCSFKTKQQETTRRENPKLKMAEQNFSLDELNLDLLDVENSDFLEGIDFDEEIPLPGDEVFEGEAIVIEEEFIEIAENVDVKFKSDLEVQHVVVEDATKPSKQTPQGEKPLSCSICGKRYKIERYHRDHEKNCGR